MTKNNTDSVNDYSFLPIQEAVSDDDLFEDKTHQRTASSLKSFISNSEKGMTIGLEGSWGSGKSTVINLLRKELDEERGKTLFFAFDAWAHDGDPLRKIFLESLIATIDPDSKDKVLLELREEVSARKKSVKVNTTKTASKLGKLLSASALAIPVGAALLSAVNYESILPPWSENAGSLSLTILFGFLLSIAPLFVILYWRICGDKNPNTGKRELDIFEAHSNETYSQDITEDGERTSIEFEKFFNQIISYLFSGKSNYKYNKVIIVVDNLDRVEADYAQNIWSTLQTFFQYRSSSLDDSKRPWIDNVWFLIPYDRYGLRRAWTDNRGLGDEKDTTSFQLAESFMQKCFQVVVEVPAPVISAWIRYFRTCVANHLIGWPRARREEFVEAYIQCKSKLDESPSPREMHSHINRVGMLALHWKDEFSVDGINLYALYKKRWTNEELRGKLLADGLPGDYPSAKSATTIKKEVAGLMFGVTSDKGMQLLLTPEITSAVSKGDSEQLSKLEKTHKEAFWVSLRACKDKWLVTYSHNDTYKLNAVTALSLAFGNAKPRIREFIKPIEEAFLGSVDDWALEHHEYHDTLRALLALSPDKENLLAQLHSGIIKRWNNSISRINDERISERELVQWHEFEKLFESNKKPFPRNYYSTLDLNHWQSWMSQCNSAEIKLKSILPAQPVFKQLVNDTRFHQHQIDQEKLELLSDTLDITPNINVWPDLHEALIGWFNLSNREVDAEHAYKFAIKLYGLSSTPEKNRLEECVSGPEFWKRGVLAKISTNPTLPFLTAIFCTEYADNNSVSPEVKQYLSGELAESEIELAFNYFKQAGLLERIWRLAGRNKTIFAKQIIKWTDDSKLFEYGGKWFDDIDWDNEDEVREITEKLCTNGAIKKVLDDIERSPNVYDKTISMLLNYGDSKSITACSKIVSNLSREQWLEVLKERNYLLSHVPDSSSTFSKAWADFFKNLINTDDPRLDESELARVFELKTKVLDLNSIHEPELLAAYFAFPDEDDLLDYEFELFSEIFSRHLDKVDRSDLERRLSLWLENSQFSRLKWFLETKYIVQGEPTEDIVASVRHGLKSAKGEEFTICSDLNKKLGLGL